MAYKKTDSDNIYYSTSVSYMLKCSRDPSSYRISKQVRRTRRSGYGMQSNKIYEEARIVKRVVDRG